MNGTEFAVDRFRRPDQRPSFVQPNFDSRGSQVIKRISKISELPVETIVEYRNYGWTDEEIVENLNDAINFLNSNLHCNELTAEIPLRSILSDQL
jgi:hypothetical protein